MQAVPKLKFSWKWSSIKPLNQEPRSKIFIFWTFGTACMLGNNVIAVKQYNTTHHITHYTPVSIMAWISSYMSLVKSNIVMEHGLQGWQLNKKAITCSHSSKNGACDFHRTLFKHFTTHAPGGDMRIMKVLFESMVYISWLYPVYRRNNSFQEMDFYQVLP